MVRYLDEYEEQCKRCKGECAIEGMSGSIVCNGFVPMTNGDRIRAMSDEDLADFLRGFNGMCETHCPFGECGIHSLSCRDLAIKWLKQEEEDG